MGNLRIFLPGCDQAIGSKRIDDPARPLPIANRTEQILSRDAALGVLLAFLSKLSQFDEDSPSQSSGLIVGKVLHHIVGLDAKCPSQAANPLVSFVRYKDTA